jgi:hypothetical protein
MKAHKKGDISHKMRYIALFVSWTLKKGKPLRQGQKTRLGRQPLWSNIVNIIRQKNGWVVYDISYISFGSCYTELLHPGAQRAGIEPEDGSHTSFTLYLPGILLQDPQYMVTFHFFQATDIVGP